MSAPSASLRCWAFRRGSFPAYARACNGPPNVKIGGKVYYELDKIPEWAANRQIALKTGHKN